MERKRDRFITILTSIFLAILMSLWTPRAAAEKNQAPAGIDLEDEKDLHDTEAEEKLLMIFLELDDLLCFLCTESLLSLCQALPAPVQRERTWMVVLVDAEKLTEYKKKLISKKIEGFIQGNSLCLPVCIDFSYHCSPMKKGGSHILLLNEETHTFDRYDFPLDSEKHSKVLGAILR
jgi:hypothetical protein